jgi:hypothetical protein
VQAGSVRFSNGVARLTLQRGAVADLGGQSAVALELAGSGSLTNGTPTLSSLAPGTNGDLWLADGAVLANDATVRVSIGTEGTFLRSMFWPRSRSKEAVTSCCRRT